MKYINYAVLTVVQLLFTLIGMIFAPLIALFANKDGWLPNWLVWFQTPDNSLDAGWQGTYFGTPLVNPNYFTKWKNRVKWLYRNPAYGLCYYPLGIAFDKTQWVVDIYESNGKSITKFKAHSIDGKYFSYVDSKWKLGWKVWAYALVVDEKSMLWNDKPWGPEMRTAICFTL